LSGRAAPSRPAARGAGRRTAQRPGRLDALETGDAVSTVLEVLSWSCRQLSPPASSSPSLADQGRPSRPPPN